MAYEPKTWACGDVVTADALNHLEQGVANAGGGGALVIKEASSRPATEEECMGLDGTVFIYDRTWQEVKDAYDAGAPVYLQMSERLNEVRYHLISITSGMGCQAVFNNGGTSSTSTITLFAETPSGTLGRTTCGEK